jgi:hypothetical protein
MDAEGATPNSARSSIKAIQEWGLRRELILTGAHLLLD